MRRTHALGLLALTLALPALLPRFAAALGVPPGGIEAALAGK